MHGQNKDWFFSGFFIPFEEIPMPMIISWFSGYHSQCSVSNWLSELSQCSESIPDDI